MAKSSSEISDPSSLSYFEVFLVLHVSVMLALCSWLYAVDSKLAHTSILVWSVPGVVILLIDWARHWRNERNALVLRVLTVLPILFFLAVDLIGRGNLAFSVVEKGEAQNLLNFNPFRPVNSAPSDSLGIWALYSGLYLTVVNVLWVAKRRRVLRPILLFGALNVAALALLGLLQEIIRLNDGTNVFATRMLFVTPAPNAFLPGERVSFFASFAHSNHWVIFAAIWMAALSVILSFPIITPHGEPPLHRFRWLLRPLYILLLASSWLASPLLFVSLLLLVLGTYWIELARYLSKFTGGRSTTHGKVLFFSTIGLVTLSVGLFFGVPKLLQGSATLITGIPDSLVRDMDALFSDGWKMVEASPVFGWGQGSYPTVHALFKQDDLFLVHHLAFPSTWTSLLIENGWLGLSLIAAFPVSLVAIYLRLHYGNPFGNVLMTTSVLVFFVGFMENLMIHPALIFSAGLIMVIGFRHGQIGFVRREGWDLDGVDNRSNRKLSPSRSGKSRKRKSSRPDKTEDTGATQLPSETPDTVKPE